MVQIHSSAKHMDYPLFFVGSIRAYLFCKMPTSSFLAAAAAAKSCQSYLTLCDPIDGSPPGSHIPGILQARTLEWVAISFSNAWKWKVKVKSLSHVPTPWTTAYQAPPSMGFPRQESLNGVPLPSPSFLAESHKRPQENNKFYLWPNAFVFQNYFL